MGRGKGGEPSGEIRAGKRSQRTSLTEEDIDLSDFEDPAPSLEFAPADAEEFVVVGIGDDIHGRPTSPRGVPLAQGSGAALAPTRPGKPGPPPPAPTRVESHVGPPKINRDLTRPGFARADGQITPSNPFADIELGPGSSGGPIPDTVSLPRFDDVVEKAELPSFDDMAVKGGLPNFDDVVPKVELPSFDDVVVPAAPRVKTSTPVPAVKAEVAPPPAIKLEAEPAPSIRAVVAAPPADEEDEEPSYIRVNKKKNKTAVGLKPVTAQPVASVKPTAVAVQPAAVAVQPAPAARSAPIAAKPAPIAAKPAQPGAAGRPAAAAMPVKSPAVGRTELEARKTARGSNDAEQSRHSTTKAFKDRAERFDVNLCVRYSVAGEFVREYAENLSKSGLFVGGAQHLKEGEVVDIEIDLPGYQNFVVKAVVVHVRDTARARESSLRAGAGLQIIGEPAGFGDALRIYLNRLGARREYMVMVTDPLCRTGLEYAGFQVMDVPPVAYLERAIADSPRPVVGVVVYDDERTEYVEAAKKAGHMGLVFGVGSIDELLSEMDEAVAFLRGE